MNPLIADRIRSLQAYEPGKPVEELRRELGLTRIVKLASNETAFGPSPKAIKVLNEPLELHRYPDPRAHDLRHALAAHHRVDAGEIAVGNGSNELIDLLCRVFGGENDHAVFGAPSFPCYAIGAIAQGLAHTPVPLVEDRYWSVDDLLSAVTPQTKLLFVANPNNPTGAHVGADALKHLLDSLPPRVIAIIDEAYVEYPDADDYRSALEVRALRKRLVVLRTFSKAYGLAALRVGYAIAPAGLVDALNRLRAPFNVGTIGQRAAVAALGDQAHLVETVAKTQRERSRLRVALEADGWSVTPSQANFLLVDVDKPGRDVYQALLRHGVIVRALAPPLDRCIRVTIGRPEENDIFLNALKSVRDGR